MARLADPHSCRASSAVGPTHVKGLEPASRATSKNLGLMRGAAPRLAAIDPLRTTRHQRYEFSARDLLRIKGSIDGAPYARRLYDTIWPFPQQGIQTADRRGSRCVAPCRTDALPRCQSIVVEDRADAAVLGEQRVAAEPEQVHVERLVALPLAVPLHFDRYGLRGLAGVEG